MIPTVLRFLQQCRLVLVSQTPNESVILSSVSLKQEMVFSLLSAANVFAPAFNQTYSEKSVLVETQTADLLTDSSTTSSH